MALEFLKEIEKGKLIKFSILFLIFGGYAVIFSEGIKFKLGLLIASGLGVGIAVFGGKTFRGRK